MEWWLAGGGDGVMVLVLENWWLSELLIRSHADWVGSTGWICMLLRLLHSASIHRE